MQQVIVVSEKAPQLNQLEAGAARRFLKDYVAYERRQGESALIQAMRLCMSPEDFDDLLDEAELLETDDEPFDADELENGSVAGAIAGEEHADLSDQEDEEKDEKQDIVGPMVKGSNTHVTKMLSRVLGPKSMEEARLC